MTAFLLRAYALHIRGSLDYDETYYYILGRNLFTGKGYTLNGLPHTAFPPLYPIFVGLTSLFTSSVALATSLISAVAGALLPLPVYFLAKNVFNGRGPRPGAAPALVAAALAAVWPALYFFADRKVAYSLRMYAGSEPLFGTLFVTGILFLWLAARRESLAYAAAAGATLGLSVLARNEATVMFGFLVLWFALDRVILSGLPKLHRALQTIIVVATFAAAVSPLVIYVHSATGSASVGSKLTNLVRTRPTLWRWIQDGDARDYVAVHNALNADATEMADDYWGASPLGRPDGSTSNIAAAVSLVTSPDFRWLGVLWRIFTGGPVPLVPGFLWPFVILGLVLPPWNGRWWSWTLLIATVALVLLLQAIAVYAIARLQLPILPLLAVAAARGLDAVARAAAFVSGILTRRLAVEPLVHAAFIAAVAVALAHRGVELNRVMPMSNYSAGAISSNPSDRELSRILAAELPPGSSLMSNKPWIALLAGLDWRVCPSADDARLLTYASARKIDFAVLGLWQTPMPAPGTPLYPYFVRTITVKSGERALLFDFRPAWSGGRAQ